MRTLRENLAIAFWRFDGSADADVDPPPDWRTREGPAVRVLNSLRPYSWRPARTNARIEYYALHQQFGGIKEGKHEVTFRWHVRLAGRGGKAGEEIAAPQQTIKIDVRKATTKSIDVLGHSIRRKLERKTRWSSLGLAPRPTRRQRPASSSLSVSAPGRSACLPRITRSDDWRISKFHPWGGEIPESQQRDLTMQFVTTSRARTRATSWR